MGRLFVLALLMLVSSVAFAQASPTITIEWTNPTTDVNGGPLTGTNSLTKFQIWISNSPLTTLPATPTIELNAAAPLQTSFVHPTSYGSTVYVRMKACNAVGCSNPTGQVQGQIPWPPAVPGSPQNVTIRITL